VASDGTAEFGVNHVVVLAIRKNRFQNAAATPTDAVLRTSYLSRKGNSGFTEETVF
jgi:hypothetical protein